MNFISSFNLTILVLKALNIFFLFLILAQIYCKSSHKMHPIECQKHWIRKQNNISHSKGTKKSADYEENRNIWLLHAKGGKGLKCNC